MSAAHSSRGPAALAYSYQAAKKLEAAVEDCGAFVIIDNDLLASRGLELVDSSDGVELAAVIRQAIKQLYPTANIHASWNLRRVSVASAIANLIGLDPFSAPDMGDARYQIIENKLGEVQGFLFDFAQPEWSALASHIRERHGSLSVYAPASFLLIVKGCEVPERFYFHGDHREGRPGEFFCDACDMFANASHFDDGTHSDNGRRYFDSLSMWD